MERHHQQRKRPGVNLISLMDIFTILVFFLLVSSSDVQQIPNKKDIRLPTSIAQTAPRETLVIAVTREQILVQGRRVADIASEMALADLIIDGLVEDPAGAARILLLRRNGCAEFPEASVDATGRVRRVQFEDGSVFGFVETHAHLLTNFGFGGGGLYTVPRFTGWVSSTPFPTAPFLTARKAAGTYSVSRTTTVTST